MHSRSSGPLTTLLMLIPLIVVPLLAVFGVPRFAPLSASNSADDDLPPIEVYTDVNVAEPASAHDHTSRVRTAGVASPAHIRAVSNSPHRDASNHTPSEADRRQPRRQPSPQRRLERRSASQWTPPSNALGQWEPDDQEADAATESVPRSKAGDAFASLETSMRSGRPGETSNADHAKLLRHLSLPDEPVLPPGASQEQPAAAQRTADANPFPRSTRRRDDVTIERPLDTVASPFKPVDETSPVSKQPDLNQPDDAGDDPGKHSRTPLTWQMAVRKLNELGIRDYQLQPGATADTFHFSCSFADARLSRLTHRFEAEATQPLQAVENVLSQIEEWEARRHRRNRRHRGQRNKTVNVSRR